MWLQKPAAKVLDGVKKCTPAAKTTAKQETSDSSSSDDEVIIKEKSGSFQIFWPLN